MTQFPYVDYITVAVDHNDSSTQTTFYTASRKCSVMFEPNLSLTDCNPNSVGEAWGIFVGTYAVNSNNPRILIKNTIDAVVGQYGQYNCCTVIINSGDIIRVSSRFGRVTGTLHIMMLPDTL